MCSLANKSCVVSQCVKPSWSFSCRLPFDGPRCPNGQRESRHEEKKDQNSQIVNHGLRPPPYREAHFLSKETRGDHYRRGSYSFPVLLFPNPCSKACRKRSAVISRNDGQ